MPKGPLVTEAVEILIAAIYNKHPKWKAKVVRREVDYILHGKNPSLPSGWPSLSAVQKVLAPVRKNNKKMLEDPLHKPWNMGTIGKYPIPSDAIPSVLKVWKLQEEKAYKFRYHKPPFDLVLSIREAKWVSRLCHVIPDDMEKLSWYAAQYAEWEELAERIGQPFDSTELDYDLMELDIPLPDEQIAILEQIRSQAKQSHEVKQSKSFTKEEATEQEGGTT